MQATLTAAPPLHHGSPAASASADLPGAASERTSARPLEPLAGAVDSSALLQGQKAVAISHNGAVYRLQATKLGKLILTK